MKEQEQVESTIKVKGMFRVQITEEGKLVGDSGWVENTVTNLGFNQYLVLSLGSLAGSKFLTHMALGTGGAPAAADTTLAGEVVKRKALTAASSSSSKTLRLTATFGSTDSFVTNNQNISNIGMFNTSSGGTLFSGNTYASSTIQTNQQVNATYDIIMS